jgi:hypothetical protein
MPPRPLQFGAMLNEARGRFLGSTNRLSASFACPLEMDPATNTSCFYGKVPGVHQMSFVDNGALILVFLCVSFSCLGFAVWGFGAGVSRGRPPQRGPLLLPRGGALGF